MFTINSFFLLENLHWYTYWACFVCCFSEGIRMHTVNGRKCEVKKALPRDDQSLLSSGRGNSKCYSLLKYSAAQNTDLTFNCSILSWHTPLGVHCAKRRQTSVSRLDDSEPHELRHSGIGYCISGLAG